MTLTEIATGDVVTASADSNIQEVLNLMDEHEVGSVVITEDDEPISIVSDRMIAMGIRGADSIEDVRVEDVMTDDLITIEAEASHFDALEKMSEAAIRRLPIVDEDGTLTGILSLDDIFVMLAAELGMASDVIEQQAGPL